MAQLTSVESSDQNTVGVIKMACGMEIQAARNNRGRAVDRALFHNSLALFLSTVTAG
jgi:hypothetical protein